MVGSQTLLVILFIGLSVCSCKIIKQNLFFAPPVDLSKLKSNENLTNVDFLSSLKEFSETLSHISKTYAEEEISTKEQITNIKNKASNRTSKAIRNFAQSLYKATTKLNAFQSMSILLTNVDVGTPPQTFLVEPTLFSSDFLLVDSECESKECLGALRKRNLFNKLSSSTYSQYDYEIETFIYFGNAGADKISISPEISFRQIFINVFEFPWFMAYFAPDGILGLGRSSQTTIPYIDTPLNSMASLLDDNVFTYYINLQTSLGENETPVGQLTFGGLDETNCGNEKSWKFVDVSPTPYLGDLYMFRLGGFRAGNLDNRRRKYAMILPGFKHIAAPVLNVLSLADVVGASFSEQYGVFVINCDVQNSPTVYLKIDNWELPITPNKYIVDIKGQMGNNVCVFGILPYEPFGLAPSWFIGANFLLQDYCIAYDFGRGRVGLSSLLQKN